MSGNLVYKPNEGATLTLIGSFRGEEDYIPVQNLKLVQHGIILGTGEDGSRITLFQCDEKPHGIRWNKGEIIVRQAFRVNYIFKGHHFKKVDDIKFNTMSVSYSYLEEWIDKPLDTSMEKMEDREIDIIKKFNFKDNGLQKATNEPEFNLVLNLEKPEIVPLVNEKEYKIFIDFSMSYPFSALRKFIAKIEAFILIEYKNEEKSWNEFYNKIRFIQDFLTIATMETVYPLKIHGRTDNYTSMIDEENEIQPNIDIIICYSKIPTSFEEPIKYNMLFSLEDIIDKINYILPRWLNKSEESQFIYLNYFGYIYRDNRILGDHFNNLVIALESYHRKNMNNYNLDPKEHKKRVNTIIELVPQEYKKWVEYKLKYNEPNLEKRLQEILEGYLDLFGGKKRAYKFVGDVVQIRNKAIIHKSNKEKIDTDKLAYTTFLLMIIFEICLLSDMGFCEEEINNLMSKKKRLRAPIFEYFSM